LTATVSTCSAAGERRRLRAGIPGQAGVRRDRAGPDRFELGQPGPLAALAALCETPGPGSSRPPCPHRCGRQAAQPGQIERFRRWGYVGRVGLEPTTGGLWEVRPRAPCAL